MLHFVKNMNEKEKERKKKKEEEKKKEKNNRVFKRITTFGSWEQDPVLCP